MADLQARSSAGSDGTRLPAEFIAVSILVFIGAVPATVYFCRSMSGGMEMPGGWTMSMTWMRMPDSASYGSMKGAVEVMTKYMAKELGPRRITVNVVAPVAIATDFRGGMVRDNPELKKRVADMTALGRAGLP